MDGVEEETTTSEEDLKKKKFREFWMGKLVKGFGEDLDVVRQVSSSFRSSLRLVLFSPDHGPSSVQDVGALRALSDR